MSKLETHLSKSEQRTARLHILTERIRYQLPARTHGRTQIHTYGCCQTRGCKEQSRTVVARHVDVRNSHEGLILVLNACSKN